MSGVTTQRELEVPIMNNLIAQAAATPLADSIRLIPLTQGKFATVDAADFEFLNQWKWCANFQHGLWYALRWSHGKHGERKMLRMHRVIAGATSEVKIDHHDGNGLNNTRINLRPATQRQNSYNKRKGPRNTSGFKGVTRHRRDEVWQAAIGLNGKVKYLGSFHVPEDAARAYDKAASEHFGEFAALNFPGD